MGLTLVLAAIAAAQAPSAASVAEAPVATCQQAAGNWMTDSGESALEIAGAPVEGREALLALRARSGDRLLVVRGGSFAGTDFRGARLHNVCFVETNLAGSDWRGADAPGIGFVRSNLAGADLRDAHMSGVLLRNPDMTGVDATGADFSGGRIDGNWSGSYENLRLDRADLSGFVVDCGITQSDNCGGIRELSLREANLAGARLSSWWFEADLTEARIDRTEVGLHQLELLNKANVAGPILLRGGDVVVPISAGELAALRPFLTERYQRLGPSFDCARAASPSERAICGEQNYDLHTFDWTVARLYRASLAVDPTVVAAQRAWLRERDRCAADLECLRRSYRRRIDALGVPRSPPGWLRPGAVALFVEPRVPIDDRFRLHPLFDRLAPAIVGDATSRVAVRVNAEGTIDAFGEAVGGNAHMCGLAGERLRLDGASGWYSGPQAAYASDPPQWRGRPMRVLRFWSDRAEVFRRGQFGAEGEDPRGSDYASCGARAGFGEMMRVPGGEAEARRLLEELDALAELE